MLNPVAESDTEPETDRSESADAASDADPQDSSDSNQEDEVWEAADVDAYRLAEAIQPKPSFLMLSPATPEWVYQWYYRTVLSCLYQVVDDIDQIFVVGYSFPPYDRRVFGLLAGIAERAAHPPTDIVNPAASDLPQETLESIFGKPRLHNHGFGEFAWSKRGT